MSEENETPQQQSVGRPPIAQTIWLKDEFDKLHNEHLLILKRLDEIVKAVEGSPSSKIIPALQKQVILAGQIATKIDYKVPDKFPPVDVPPPSSPQNSEQITNQERINMPPEGSMTQQDAVNALTKTNETLVKVSNETDSLLKEIDTLKKALEEAGGPGGTITPELAAAVEAVGVRADSIDALVEDVQQPEGKSGKSGSGGTKR